MSADFRFTVLLAVLLVMECTYVHSVVHKYSL